jgi:hypothetical protein
MSEFMLLLHESPSDFSDVSPEEIQRIIGEYTAWRDELEKKARLVQSHKLRDEGGRSLSLESGSVRVVDGPYSEAKEVVGGYFVIRASDYAEAVEISRGCPHLKFGGRIELREIEQLER